MSIEYLKENVAAIFYDYLATDKQIKSLYDSIEVAGEYEGFNQVDFVKEKIHKPIQIEVSTCCSQPMNIAKFPDFGGYRMEYTCQCCGRKTHPITKTFYLK